MTQVETHLTPQPLAHSLPVMLSSLLLDVRILIGRHWQADIMTGGNILSEWSLPPRTGGNHNVIVVIITADC